MWIIRKIQQFKHLKNIHKSRFYCNMATLQSSKSLHGLTKFYKPSPTWNSSIGISSWLPKPPLPLIPATLHMSPRWTWYINKDKLDLHLPCRGYSSWDILFCWNWSSRRRRRRRMRNVLNLPVGVLFHSFALSLAYETAAIHGQQKNKNKALLCARCWLSPPFFGCNLSAIECYTNI